MSIPLVKKHKNLISQYSKVIGEEYKIRVEKAHTAKVKVVLPSEYGGYDIPVPMTLFFERELSVHEKDGIVYMGWKPSSDYGRIDITYHDYSYAAMEAIYKEAFLLPGMKLERSKRIHDHMQFTVDEVRREKELIYDTDVHRSVVRCLERVSINHGIKANCTGGGISILKNAGEILPTLVLNFNEGWFGIWENKGKKGTGKERGLFTKMKGIDRLDLNMVRTSCRYSDIGAVYGKMVKVDVVYNGEVLEQIY